ncbi:hypothetical protein MASR1M90_09570 [Desulfovibrionales bacterium]
MPTTLSLSSCTLPDRLDLLPSLFTAFSDLVLWCSPGGHIRQSVGGSLHPFSVDSGHLVTRNIRALPELIDPDLVTEALNNLSTQESCQICYILHTNTGQAHVEASLQCLSADTIRIVLRDVTERARAVQALRFTQDKLDHIIESLPDATLVVDKDHRVIAWNKALVHMTGIPKSAILGKGDFEYAIPFYGYRRPILLDFIGKDPSTFYPLLPQTQERDDALTTETFVPALYYGQGAFVWAMATHLYDNEGRQAGAIQSIRDVTEKKRSEISTQILYHVATVTNSQTSEKEMFRQLFDVMVWHLNVASMSIVLPDPVLGTRTYPFAQEKTPQRRTQQGHIRALKLASEVIRTSRPAQVSLSYPPQTQAERITTTRWFGVPIICNAQNLGAMVVELQEASSLFLTNNDQLLTAVAEHLGLALNHCTAQNALHVSEEKFRSIFENAVDGIFQISLDLHLLSANPAMAHILGYATVADLMNHSMGFLSRLLPPARRTDVLQRIAAAEVITGFEFAITKDNGDTAWLSLNLRSVSGSDGTTHLLEGSLADISARKEAEHRLERQKSLFRQLFDNSPQAIVLLGPKGTPLDVNQSFIQLFGLTLEDENALLEVLLAPDDLDESYAFLTQVLNGTSQSMETTRRRKNQERFPVSILGYPYMLEGKISGAFFIFTDISERKNYEDKLTRQALFDSLTDLPNRVLFMDRLQQAMERQKRRPEYRFAAIMIDLDEFKRINDSLGHQVGDQLLHKVSARLKECVRSVDTVARLGGDEFAVLIEDFRAIREVTSTIRRILHDIRQPILIHSRSVSISASVGVVLHTAHYTSPTDLMRDADISMYRSKERGKNQFKVFSKSMFEQVAKAVQMETDLRQALASDQFELFFQPIFSLPDKTLDSFEALVRWNHPVDGILGPGAFIPVAEETGLISDLGRWVLHKGCAILTKWVQDYPNLPVTLALNLSPKDLMQPNLVSFIFDLLKYTRLEPGRLKLEITETAVMGNPGLAISKLERLQKMGIRICMDDFGTGYSSLSYLQRLPIDILKIDRSFIATMLENSSNLEIIKAILGLGKILDLRTVAEGVETQEQLDALIDMGCDLTQGYLLGRPMPLAQAITLLEQAHSKA